MSAFATGNFIYAIDSKADLYWYRHDGQADGTDRWTERSLVGQGGWNKFVSVFSGGGNIIYAIDPEGHIYWYRHDGQANGTPQWSERALVFSGTWNNVLSAFAAGKNILYAIGRDGNLFWYRHKDQPVEATNWLTEFRQVGDGGWDQYVSVFSGGGNIIYAIDANGDLYWYRHDGQEDGSKRWTSRNRVGQGGWLIYKSVFSPGNGILYGLGTDTTSWMSGVPQSRKLNQFTIPGTHDTGTWPLPSVIAGFDNNAKCQTLSLEQQLKAGIRFIDVRVVQDTRNGKPDFQLYHAREETGLWFSTDIVSVCKNFLAAHPTETIIMSIKDEFGTTDKFEDHVKLHLDPSFSILDTTIPTLRDARGRIVLFRRYEFGTCGIPAYQNWPPDSTGDIRAPDHTLKVQDVYGYGFSEDWADDMVIAEEERVAKLDKKWNAFVQPYLVNAANETADNVWWINFTSASGPPPIIDPIDFAKGIPGHIGINATLCQFLAQKPLGHFGMVIMDFPEYPNDGEPIKRLIRTNLAC